MKLKFDLINFDVAATRMGVVTLLNVLSDDEAKLAIAQWRACRDAEDAQDEAEKASWCPEPVEPLTDPIAPASAEEWLEPLTDPVAPASAEEWLEPLTDPVAPASAEEWKPHPYAAVLRKISRPLDDCQGERPPFPPLPLGQPQEHRCCTPACAEPAIPAIFGGDDHHCNRHRHERCAHASYSGGAADAHQSDEEINKNAARIFKS